MSDLLEKAEERSREHLAIWDWWREIDLEKQVWTVWEALRKSWREEHANK